MTEFRSFIANLIVPCGLDSLQREILLDAASLELYTKAFTHVSYDAYNHYEVYEQLGDITVNKFLVWYFHHRLAHHGALFHSTLGVKIVARLRIKYGSKQQLSDLAERLGFWPYIRITESVSQGKRLSILEDVFEAFIGVTEFLIDSRLMVGLGYIVCYRILQSLFDPMTIDISYEQLFDAKTRLKELFDVYRDQLGSLQYEYEKQNTTGHAWVQITRIPPGTQEKVLICTATHAINKALAEQQASEDALKILSRQGYTRDIPLEYRQMLSQLTTVTSSAPTEEKTRGGRR
jgi:dsRNA-specific ribonuclease